MPTKTSLIKKFSTLLTPLASLTLVKQGYGQDRKYSKQANTIVLSDICFLIDKFNAFINKNPSEKLVQYIASRQKEVAGLLEKRVFKFVTSDSISSNARIFNSCFVDKIKNLGTDKVYEKSWLFVQTYNNKEKDFVLTQLPIIQ